jgi:hypothetical protein
MVVAPDQVQHFKGCKPADIVLLSLSSCTYTTSRAVHAQGYRAYSPILLFSKGPHCHDPFFWEKQAFGKGKTKKKERK